MQKSGALETICYNGEVFLLKKMYAGMVRNEEKNSFSHAH